MSYLLAQDASSLRGTGLTSVLFFCILFCRLRTKSYSLALIYLVIKVTFPRLSTFKSLIYFFASSFVFSLKIRMNCTWEHLTVSKTVFVASSGHSKVSKRHTTDEIFNMISSCFLKSLPSPRRFA